MEKSKTTKTLTERERDLDAGCSVLLLWLDLLRLRSCSSASIFLFVVPFFLFVVRLCLSLSLFLCFERERLGRDPYLLDPRSNFTRPNHNVTREFNFKSQLLAEIQRPRIESRTKVSVRDPVRDPDCVCPFLSNNRNN